MDRSLILVVVVSALPAGVFLGNLVDDDRAGTPVGAGFDDHAALSGRFARGQGRRAPPVNNDFDSFFTSTYSRTLATALLLDGHRQDDEGAAAEAYAIVAANWDVAGNDDAPEAHLQVTTRRLVRRALQRTKRRAEALAFLTTAIPVTSYELRGRT
jgi:hypothetical protein